MLDILLTRQEAKIKNRSSLILLSLNFVLSALTCGKISLAIWVAVITKLVISSQSSFSEHKLQKCFFSVNNVSLTFHFQLQSL